MTGVIVFWGPESSFLLSTVLHFIVHHYYYHLHFMTPVLRWAYFDYPPLKYARAAQALTN